MKTFQVHFNFPTSARTFQLQLNILTSANLSNFRRSFPTSLGYFQVKQKFSNFRLWNLKLSNSSVFPTKLSSYTFPSNHILDYGLQGIHGRINCNLENACNRIYHSELGFLLFQNIFLLLQWFFIQLETSLYFIQPEVKPEVRL